MPKVWEDFVLAWVRRCHPDNEVQSQLWFPLLTQRSQHPATACQLLRAGGSLVEIGQVLRHDSLGATARYARVDVERLLTIARAWPTGATS